MSEKVWIPVILSAFDVDYTCGGEDFEYDIPLYRLGNVYPEEPLPE